VNPLRLVRSSPFHYHESQLSDIPIIQRFPLLNYIKQKNYSQHSYYLPEDLILLLVLRDSHVILSSHLLDHRSKSFWPAVCVSMWVGVLVYKDIDKNIHRNRMRIEMSEYNEMRIKIVWKSG
jgi:hypothetical protein